MKQVIFSTWKEKCGIADYTEQLVDALKKQAHDVEVVRIPSDLLSDGSVGIFSKFKIIGRFFSGYEKCDVSHIQHEFGLFGFKLYERILLTIYAVKKTSGGAKFVTLHTVCAPDGGFGGGMRGFVRRFFYRNLWVWFYRKLSKLCFVIVHTEKSRNDFIKFGGDPKKVIIVPHGVSDLDAQINDYSSDNKLSLGYKSTDKLISVFGFVSWYKGVDLAVDAIKVLPENFKLAVVGGLHPKEKEDSTFASVVKVASEIGANRVRVTGYLEINEMNRYLSATDIVIAPYREVGLSASGALTFGLRSGKPVIATEIDAFVNVNSDCGCLYLIKPDSVSELVEAIVEIDKNAQLVKTLTDRAANYCHLRSWSAIADFMVSDVYTKKI